MNQLEKSDLPLPQKIADSLARVFVAMRADNWDWFGAEGLNPVQGQVLLLLNRRGEPLRLSAIADELQVTNASMSDSVATLADKGFVRKQKAPDDGRALAVTITNAGKKLAVMYDSEGSAVTEALSRLPESEQTAMYHSLLRVIRELQEAERIPLARMCVTCRYFRPNVHENLKRPHHCALVDVAIGDKTLRNDCPEHEQADKYLSAQNWTSFLQNK